MSNEQQRFKTNRASFWAHVYTHTMVHNNAVAAMPAIERTLNWIDPEKAADAALVLFDARFSPPVKVEQPQPDVATPIEAKPMQPLCKEPGCRRFIGHDGPHLIK